MKTYVIVDVRITDPARYEDYKKLTPASLLPFDGRFLVRGGQTELLEGTWKPGRTPRQRHCGWYTAAPTSARKVFLLSRSHLAA